MKKKHTKISWVRAFYLNIPLKPSVRLGKTQRTAKSFGKSEWTHVYALNCGAKRFIRNRGYKLKEKKNIYKTEHNSEKPMTIDFQPVILFLFQRYISKRRGCLQK